VWFEGSDGGLVRSSGQYVSISDSCPTRPFIGRSPAVLLTCQRLLSAVPTAIFSLNSGLQTLQFQHLSINPRNPLGELQGGTQDNGTFQFEGSVDTWLESIGGDGGLSGFDASNPTNRFHTFLRTPRAAVWPDGERQVKRSAGPYGRGRLHGAPRCDYEFRRPMNCMANRGPFASSSCLKKACTSPANPALRTHAAQAARSFFE
jgi:hypothetical protein